MSLPLFVLSLLVIFLCMIYLCWHVPEPGQAEGVHGSGAPARDGHERVRSSLSTSILFFIFWEVVLVPMYFMIGIWGGPRRRVRGGQVLPLHAVRLDLHAAGLPGSIGLNAGTFDMVELARAGRATRSELFQNLVFLGLFLGFAIKVPMWPFHTWLPDAHTEAPTVGSVLLAAIMLKMGTYGFIRIVVPDPARRRGHVRADHRDPRRHRDHLRSALLSSRRRT